MPKIIRVDSVLVSRCAARSNCYNTAWCRLATTGTPSIICSMQIGINAHLLSFGGNYRQAGLSRYIYELAMRAPGLMPGDRFAAFVGNEQLPRSVLREAPANLVFSKSRFPTAKAPVRIAWEQLVLPAAALRARLKLLHCPVNVVPLLCPCPSVITIHDLIFLRYPENFKPAKRRYLTAMTTLSARGAAHVIAVSEATRQDVIELLGVPPGKVTTVHNGVGEQFRPLSEEARATFAQEKGVQGRVVFYVGTLEPRKNLVTLLRAFSALVEEPDFSDVKLVIGGSKGWYYEEIFATAEALGLTGSGRVRFLGRVPDEELPLWYNIAAVFAYPSIYEGFGLPALEAMSCGTPVVTSDTSCFPEVVGDAGMMVPPGEKGAWTAALRTLLSEPERAAALGLRGLARAAGFSWDKAAAETVEVYRRVLEKERAGTAAGKSGNQANIKEQKAR